MQDILLGIDLGTTSLRAGFYDKSGKNYGFFVEEYGLIYPGQGFVEQDPKEWIRALKSAVRKGMENLGISRERILGLAAGSTCCSVVLCDEKGEPVRDCIMWMDIRAAEEAWEIQNMTGERLSAEWMPCKLLWLKKHEAENYQKAQVFCECQDWLTHYLTGIWSINVNTACNWGYNDDEKGFPEWFYEKIGLREALEKFPRQNCYAVGDKIGYLTRESAEELGLSEKVFVAQGGVDSSIGILGMGVCGPDRMALMTGSSNLTMLLTKEQMFTENTITAGPNHLLAGYYTSFRGQISANSIIEWFRKEIAQEDDAAAFFERMEKEAGQVPAGSRGLIALDFFQGNRHPYLDTRVRGMIYGLSLKHTKADIYRCLLEGIAYGTGNLLRQYRQAGVEIGEVNISGGTTNSDVFMQIMADVGNVKINVPADCQSVCMGAAICAAYAAGYYDSLPDAVSGMVSYKKVLEPKAENVGKYQRLFQKYREIYPLMKEWMHEMWEISS